ncbi:MAG TPA: ABC transporter substrate-binding protein [Bacillota bacterium]
MILLTTACGGPAQPATGGAEPGQNGDDALPALDPPQALRIAEDGSPSGAAFYIATERGYFAELGLQPEFVTFESSAYMLPAVASGDVDVAGGVMTASFLNAVERGLPIKIIADKGRNIPGASYFDLVRSTRVVDEVQSLEDLRGRRIAITSEGSVDHIFADLALRAAGLTEDEVEWVVIRDFGQMNPALANGSVDVAMHIEPLITAGEADGILDRWIDATEFAPDFQVAVALASPAFIQDRQDAARRFMVAYLKGLRDYHAAFIEGVGTDEIIDIMTRYTPMDDPDLWRKVNVVGLSPDGYVISESIQFQIEWFKEKGLYDGDLTAEDLVDNSLIDFALDHLGGPLAKDGD